MKDDNYNLDRFVKAQNICFCGYECALNEVREGSKRSHWIWYIFPQLKSLGHSNIAVFYGIDGIAEATQYLQHEILGKRLYEITSALMSHRGEDPIVIFGQIDALKVRSCMTLFDIISPNDIFADVLETFFHGIRCKRTSDELSNCNLPDNP